MPRFIVFFLLLVTSLSQATAAEIECRWINQGPEKTQVVLESSAPIPHQIFTLDQPDRVVIDIRGGKILELPPARSDDPILIGMRAGPRRNDELRLVLDLKTQARVKSFEIGPRGDARYRLFIELSPKPQPGLGLMPVADRGQTLAMAPGAWSAQRRAAVIVIDAGHGGDDPGAIGPNGTREKDVTLAIARRLARLIEREPGMRAVMLREGDYTIHVRDRPVLARRHRPDLLLSIHADGYPDPNARGSSVYTFGYSASNELAGLVAAHENGAERLSDQEKRPAGGLLDAVLYEMIQGVTLEHSRSAASAILHHLRRVGTVHRNEVLHDRFEVLKSGEFPSVLVETAFITNAEEERLLTHEPHQQLLAQAILAGVKDYLSRNPPQRLVAAGASTPTERSAGPRPVRSAEGSRPGRLEYVINQGDTLSAIAKRYGVSLSALCAENGLGETDVIRAGQVITIPADS